MTSAKLQPIKTIRMACLHTIIKSQTLPIAQWEHKQTGDRCAVNQDMWIQPTITKLSYHAWYLPSLFCTPLLFRKIKEGEGRTKMREGWGSLLMCNHGPDKTLRELSFTISSALSPLEESHMSGKGMQTFPRIRFPIEGIGEPWTYWNVQTHIQISDSSTQLMDHGCHEHNVITIDLFQLSKGHTTSWGWQ